MGAKPIDFAMLDCGYTPIDLDTFVMNNEDTSKELVGRTYAGVDGYCPLAVYLGAQGYRKTRICTTTQATSGWQIGCAGR